MKKISIFLLFTIMTGCGVIGALMGNYDTRVSSEPLLLEEGIIVATLTTEYEPVSTVPSLLFMKENECIGFMAFSKGQIQVGSRNINLLKLPEGVYRNSNWGIYINRPPTWGKYIYPTDGYDLRVTAQAGKIVYVGHFVTSETGIEVRNNQEEDMEVVFEQHPYLRELELVADIASIEAYQPWDHCR